MQNDSRGDGDPIGGNPDRYAVLHALEKIVEGAHAISAALRECEDDEEPRGPTLHGKAIDFAGFDDLAAYSEETSDGLERLWGYLEEAGIVPPHVNGEPLKPWVQFDQVYCPGKGWAELDMAERNGWRHVPRPSLMAPDAPPEEWKH